MQADPEGRYGCLVFVSVGRRDFEITSFKAAVIQYGDMDELFDDQILVNSCTFNCKNCVLWKLSGVAAIRSWCSTHHTTKIGGPTAGRNMRNNCMRNEMDEALAVQLNFARASF